MDRARDLAEQMTAAGVPSTTDPRSVAGQAQQAVVLVGVPDVDPGPIGGGWDLLWRPVVICAHPDPLTAADRVLTAVELLTTWDRGLTDGRPVSWQMPDGNPTSAFAYELQYRDTLTQEM